MACGILATAAVMTSCESTSLTPEKAVQRIERSQITTVYSHNDVNSPRLRDCYEAGPLPERAQRALITWLHNSSVREFSYVYPQYYLVTTNNKGGGEVVWGLCSDGHGNLVGVLVPFSKRTPAWDLPTIGGYKVLVCDTPERQALSDAIMESLADAGYDQVRIDSRKAIGIVDKNHLISKPLNADEQLQLERERRERERAKAEAAKRQKAAAEAAEGSSDEDEEDTGSSSTSSGDDEDEDISSFSSGDNDGDSGSSDEDTDSDSSSSDEDSDSGSSSDDDEDEDTDLDD